MKKLLVVLAVTLSIMFACSSATTLTRESKKKKLYTACNIWVHNYMQCINYKVGKFIPAGTEVYNIGIESKDLTHVFFKTVINKKRYKIQYNTRWHSGINSKDYKNYLFTEKTFDELVEGMTEIEINAIKQGKIVVEMSKEAVLISYGRPAEHRTPDLKSNKWIYWMNKRNQKIICFHNGLTIYCSDMKKLANEL